MPRNKTIHHRLSSFANRHIIQVFLCSVFSYILKNVFWPLTFVFYITYSFTIVSFIILKGYKVRIYPFIRDFSGIIILYLIFLTAYLFHGDFQNTFYLKEVIRPFILITLYYFGYHLLVIKNNKLTKYKLEKYFLIAISILGVLNLVHNSFPDLSKNKILKLLNISSDISIANDPNLLCLFFIFGFILLYNRKNTLRFRRNYNIPITLVLTIIFILNIFLSASRRGIFIFGLIICLQTSFTIIYYIRKHSLKQLLRLSGKTVLLLLISGIIIWSFLKIIPKERITASVLRYSSFAGINDYKYIERLLWEKHFDYLPKDGIIIDNNSLTRDKEFWEPINYTDNIERTNTPYGHGYRLKREKNDSPLQFYYNGPTIIYYAHHTYNISFKVKLLKGEENSFAIGWHANDGGRGRKTLSIIKELKPLKNGWYNCSASYTFIDNQLGINGFITHLKKDTEIIIADFSLTDLDYNENLPQFAAEVKTFKDVDEHLNSINKPVFDSLNLVNNGNFTDGLKYWASNADSTQLSIIKSDNSYACHVKRDNGDGSYWSLIYTGRAVRFYANDIYKLSFKLKVLTPNKGIPFKIGYWVNEGDGYLSNLKPDIDTLDNKWLQVTVSNKFKFDQKNIGFFINSQKDNSEFLITDIELINHTRKQTNNYQEKNLNSESDHKQFVLLGDRLSRWKYALDIWESDYSLGNKLFGKGFYFLEKFSEKFADGKRGDYPHNPFISIILYSGIIGFLIYFLILIKICLIYYRYRSRYTVLMIFFAATFIFSLFSALNPLDPPILGFLFLLPITFKYY